MNRIQISSQPNHQSQYEPNFLGTYPDQMPTFRGTKEIFINRGYLFCFFLQAFFAYDPGYTGFTVKSF